VKGGPYIQCFTYIMSETFLASRYIKRLAKNPLIEAISLLVPTGPLITDFNSSCLWYTRDR